MRVSSHPDEESKPEQHTKSPAAADHCDTASACSNKQEDWAEEQFRQVPAKGHEQRIFRVDGDENAPDRLPPPQAVSFEVLAYGHILPKIGFLRMTMTSKNSDVSIYVLSPVASFWCSVAHQFLSGLESLRHTSFEGYSLCKANTQVGPGAFLGRAGQS